MNSVNLQSFDSYEPKNIEPFWQDRWQKEGVFVAPSATRMDGTLDPRPKYYILEMFPYPSGRLHMGHVRNYSIGDVLARAYRMMGHRVLYPLGWDAFGLPAENAAIKAKVHPQEWTKTNIAAMKVPMLRLGLSYDLTREITTCDPSYFVHEQRLFVEMFQKGLAYRKAAQVNFCPTCGTVLANEQVEDGKCWRCQSMVEQRDLVQWFLRITAYAEELLADLNLLENKWPEKVLNMQRQWIGKSEGAKIRFSLEKPCGHENAIEVFTTRPDTLFGVTFLSLAPEHPLAPQLAHGTSQEAAVNQCIDSVRNQDKIERMAENTPKQGVFTGSYAIHPATQQKIPIYLANFVLMDYGTGAVMAVPAHDDRDFAFAKQHNLPIKIVVQNSQNDLEVLQLKSAYTEAGILCDSDRFDGLSSESAKKQIVDWLTEQHLGEPTVHFKLRDWLVSRQRYWGCPIPMVQCLQGGHGHQPVPAKDLPVTLPQDVDFSVVGASPLERHPTWKHTLCPVCQGPALRETDTMDGFMESSWYFLRYTSPHDQEHMANEEGWQFLPVEQYIGGAEHATKHLIYARFFTKMLSDFGKLPKSMREPFLSLLTQGMVLKDAYRCEIHDYLYPEQVSADGHCTECGNPAKKLRHMKMSKTFRNVVEPIPLIEKYGADTARLFSLFAAPPDSVLEWNDDAIEGAHRFLQRVYRLVQRFVKLSPSAKTNPKDRDLLRKTHQTIARVRTDVFERKQFNTAIAALMELCNEMYAYLGPSNEKSTEPAIFQTDALQQAVRTLVLLLNPFAPHLGEQLWHMLGETTLAALQPFPTFSEELAKNDEITLVIQVNGKKRGELQIAPDAPEEEAKNKALQLPNVAEHIGNKPVKKCIYVAGRLLNWVV